MNPRFPYLSVALVTVALLGLLGLTLAAARVNLGPFNTLAALGISLAKAGLILVCFMELRVRARLNWIALSVGIFCLAILFVLAFCDFATRQY